MAERNEIYQRHKSVAPEVDIYKRRDLCRKKLCDMTHHFHMCPKVRVSCELCGEVMCREDMTQHLKQDCVEKEIECPFAEYKCEVGLIKRKYLNKHLEEKRIEHLELKLTAMKLELISKETIIEDLKLTVKQQSRKIREQSNYRVSLFVYWLFVCLYLFLRLSMLI